jgi:hypothetical protein
MTQDYPILTIEGDVDGDGNAETGVFEMPSADVSPIDRTGYLFRSGEGGVVSTLISRTVGEQGTETVVAGNNTLAFEVEIDSWEDNSAQWGNDATPGKSATSATGAAATTQLCVLLRYIVESVADSGNPAKFEWGEFADDGLYDPIGVAVEQPTLSRTRDQTSSFTATFTVVAVRDLTSATNHDELRLP